MKKHKTKNILRVKFDKNQSTRTCWHAATAKHLKAKNQS